MTRISNFILSTYRLVFVAVHEYGQISVKKIFTSKSQTSEINVSDLFCRNIVCEKTTFAKQSQITYIVFDLNLEVDSQ